MHKYLSTYITGFDKVIKNQLREVEIITQLDGLVVYKTEAKPHRAATLRLFNNTFLILSSIKIKNDENIEQIVHGLYQKANWGVVKKLDILKHIASVRIIVSKENVTPKVKKALRNQIEENISHILEVKIDKLMPDTEFWFIIRREKFAYFGMRITDIGHKRYLPKKGELRPELANILCLISDPRKSDVVIDPFAGFGSILAQRVKYFPYQKAIAIDNDESKISFLKSKFAKHKSRTQVVKSDGLRLKNMKNNSVDKIITDPPWGLFEGKNENYTEFYTQMITEFTRILKVKGVAVVLTARKNEMKKALSNIDRFDLQEEYNILVSGKKAGVYKLQLSN